MIHANNAEISGLAAKGHHLTTLIHSVAVALCASR